MKLNDKFWTIMLFTLLLVACQPNKPIPSSELYNNPKDTITNIELKKLEGVWQDINNNHETSFYIFKNNTLYLLTGAKVKIGIRNDTIITPKNDPFIRRKIVRIDPNELYLMSRLGDTLKFKRIDL